MNPVLLQVHFVIYDPHTSKYSCLFRSREQNFFTNVSYTNKNEYRSYTPERPSVPVSGS